VAFFERFLERALLASFKLTVDVFLVLGYVATMMLRVLYVYVM